MNFLLMCHFYRIIAVHSVHSALGSHWISYNLKTWKQFKTSYVASEALLLNDPWAKVEKPDKSLDTLIPAQWHVIILEWNHKIQEKEHFVESAKHNFCVWPSFVPSC